MKFCAEAGIAATGWFKKRLRTWKERLPQRLHLLESLSLGEKKRIAFVECDRRRLLIGSTEGSLSLLADLTPHVTDPVSADPALSDDIPTWSCSQPDSDGRVRMERLKTL